MGAQKLTDGQRTALELAAYKTTGGDTWRPQHGYYEIAEYLKRQGLLLNAGISAMPPHKLYVISDAGREALRSEAKEGKL